MISRLPGGVKTSRARPTSRIGPVRPSGQSTSMLEVRRTLPARRAGEWPAGVLGGGGRISFGNDVSSSGIVPIPAFLSLTIWHKGHEAHAQFHYTTDRFYRSPVRFSG